MTTIDIYSGFLGAGKTTLIKKMIREAYQGEKIVLIENEFGEIGIDGSFLQEAGIEIREINSGCICCSLVGDFGKALEQVVDQYHPDRVLIEPSGVGKLSDVIAAVKKVTGDQVQLGYTVAVADAGKCKVYMRNFGEFYNNQIETASTIVLSRTDSISQEKLDAAVALLREHNAVATMVTTPWNQLTGLQLIEAMEHKQTLADELAQMQMQRLAEDQEAHAHSHSHEGVAMIMGTIRITKDAVMIMGTMRIMKGAVMTMGTMRIMRSAVTVTRIMTLRASAAMAIRAKAVGITTITQMRSSTAGVWKQRESLQGPGFRVLWRSWSTATWVPSCGPKASFLQRMEHGFISTTSLGKRIFEPAALL